MAYTTIDSKLLSRMFIAGAKNLEAKKEWINELNVFPVPDGDTGTNMTMTIMSAARELTQVDDSDMKAVCKAMSSGSLRGARGNSGVILSQLIRGFTKIVKTKDALTVDDLNEAFDKAVETAYKAVMKPKEGTILTVAKGGADKAKELAAQNVDMETFIREVILYMDEVLDKTPDMLPVLKQAGVVDSGGQGLMQALKGAQDVFLGKEVDLSLDGDGSAEEDEEEENVKFVYDTKFDVLLTKNFNIKTEQDFTKYLESIGDKAKVTVYEQDEVLEVSLLTNDPGLVLQKALLYGELHDVVVTNLRTKDKTITKTKKEEEIPMEHKDIAFVAVSVGDGLSEIFKGLGADYIIAGGQTMNPSTEDILNAVEKLNADHVIVLPNNKNIILAANQAQSLVTDKKLHVVPTKTIPQGITALINFMPDLSAEENVETMISEITNVKSGEVTYAVRDTQIDGKDIKQGDYMGIGDAGILAVNPDKEATSIEMLREMLKDGAELISVYYGQDVAEEEAQSLVSKINESFPGVDVELQYGGQPIYYYIMSAE
ncbi:MAG: DAK2 domain-containing protein [Lachnospiraceae bacterium]|nr:DAK2 domain-containing protein [Lachnospiraceae bacterium]